MYLIPGASSIGLYAWASQQGYHDINHLAYLAASLCCVGALGGLSNQKTARLGNSLGMLGVSLGKSNKKEFLMIDQCEQVWLLHSVQFIWICP